LNEHIRNFCIIAHIDHGKSTLADQLLLRAGAISSREFHAQFLDNMDLERERGITIKARAVNMVIGIEGESYSLNLIDTPGHVDFSYEVSRSLEACEGALLIVDASQGVEAQTVANTYLALEAGLEIIPVLNKVDLDSARPEEVIRELEHTFGFKPEEIVRCSAKSGLGIDDVLAAVAHRVPPPRGDPATALRALIFDSTYDDYRGVIIYVRLVDGSVGAGDVMQMMSTGRTWEVLEVGCFSAMQMESKKRLHAGEVGYVICNIKSLGDVHIGDTLTRREQAASVRPLPGYKEPLHMVYCGLYPTNNADYELLRKALDKLHLNDCSFSYEPESSEALGFGFRCGFLGLLHMEIVQERLERESDIDLVQTAPNVTYEVSDKHGKVHHIDSPSKLPEDGMIEEMREPVMKVSLLIPADCIGTLMKLCEDRRGVYRNTDYISETRVILTYELPLAEIVYDFYDLLKSATRGYGTMDYELLEYRSAQLVRLRILVNGVEVDALTAIMHRSNCERRGRKLLQRLRREIPRHQFKIPLQAAIGGRIVAREDIAPMRKDVIAKCYGGDISRKRKLLDKQKEGKKRMKSIGNVEIPQKAFMAVLSVGDEDESKPGKR